MMRASNVSISPTFLTSTSSLLFAAAVVLRTGRVRVILRLSGGVVHLELVDMVDRADAFFNISSLVFLRAYSLFCIL